LGRPEHRSDWFDKNRPEKYRGIKEKPEKIALVMIFTRRSFRPDNEEARYDLEELSIPGDDIKMDLKWDVRICTEFRLQVLGLSIDAGRKRQLPILKQIYQKPFT
jgi:hypothetical protein